MTGYFKSMFPGLGKERTSPFFLKSFTMTLVREMPVNRVSQIINVDDNKLWRMMHYYVDAARQKEDYSGAKQIGVEEDIKSKRA